MRQSGARAEPSHLLSRPVDFRSNILIVYDATMREKHRVGAGIEEADRWEVFTQLTEILPRQLLPTPMWEKTRIFTREQPSFDASQQRKKVLNDIRLAGLKHLSTPALIEICSPDADQWEQFLLEEVGVSAQDLVDGCVNVPTSSGARTILTIAKRSFLVDLSAELPSEAMESDDDMQGLTLQRVRQIEKALPKVEANAGILLEMLNYQELYSIERARRHDPKRAARWGLARTGRKLQCIQPESASVEDCEETIPIRGRSACLSEADEDVQTEILLNQAFDSPPDWNGLVTQAQHYVSCHVPMLNPHLSPC